MQDFAKEKNARLKDGRILYGDDIAEMLGYLLEKTNQTGSKLKYKREKN